MYIKLISIGEQAMNGELTQTQTAYQLIFEKIVNGDIREGYPLLEVEIADQLNMSRTPVREALLRLRAHGLVDKVSKKGLFVKILSKDEVKQTYEFLEGVESMVSYLLAGSIEPEGIMALGRLIERMEKAFADNDMDAWVEADSQFHDTMLEYCQNPYIVAEMKKANILVRRVRDGIVRYALDKEPSMQDHKALFEAIRDGDKDQARALTQAHIKRIREQLIKLL
jgi:DNA-binding GntR family transcriptional regulator